MGGRNADEKGMGTRKLSPPLPATLL